MASTTVVKKKFVILLALGVLGLVAGAGALLVYSQAKSAERDIERGERLTAEAEALMEAGQAEEAYAAFREAAGQFGRAVNKQDTNIDYLNRFTEALLRTRPDSQSAYEQRYNEYFAAMRERARVLFNDPVAQLEFIDLYNERVRTLSGRAQLDRAMTPFIAEVNDRLQRLPDEDSPERALLRGYRGLAVVERMLRTSVDEQERQDALADLEAALAANPDRSDMAVGVLQWHVAEYQTLGARRSDAAADVFERGVARSEELLESFGDSPDVVAYAATMRVSGPDFGDLDREDRRERIAAYLERRDRVIDLLLQMPADEIDRRMLQETENMLLGAGESRADEVADRLLAERRDSPLHLLYAAAIYTSRNQYERALGAYDAIIEMPSPELSLEGLMLPTMQVRAAVGQADIALTQVRRTSDAGVRMEAFEEAKRYFERATEIAAAQQTDDLKRVSAEIRLLEGDVREARRLFEELRADLGESPQVLIGLARCAAALENYDLAQDYYERVLEASPIGSGRTESLEYAVELANVYVRNGLTERALAVFTDLRNAVGENEFVASRERALRTLVLQETRVERARLERQLEQTDPGTGERRRLEIEVAALRAREQSLSEGVETDPVLEIVGNSSVLLEQGDVEGAVAALASGVERFPNDLRLHRALIQAQVTAGDNDAARATLAAALERFPNSADLRRIEALLADGSQYENIIALIEQSEEMTPLNRALEKTRAAARFDRRDDVERFLNEARAIDQDNADVVNFGFTLALERGDFDEAQRLAERARTLDADQVDGLTYEGRLALQRGELADAIEAFEEAAERIPSEPLHWRSLANALAASGQVDRAIEAFDRALSLRSGDADAAREYASVLFQVGRAREALDLIGRDSDLFAATRSDPRLRDLYLRLEAAVGNTEVALRERRTLFENAPENGANTLAYLTLLNQIGRTGRAREVLAQVAQNEEAKHELGRSMGVLGDVALTVIEANRLAAAGDAAAGANLWEQRLPALAEQSLGPDAHLRYVQYLLDHRGANANFEQRAFAVLEQARPLQSATRRSVDRAIAQSALQRAAEIERATELAERMNDEDRVARLRAAAADLNERGIEALRRVLEASTDADDRVNLRRALAQTLIRLERFSEAREVTRTVLEEEPDDLTTLLLLAEIQQSEGNIRGARETLDAAVAAHPDSHRPFLARALVNRDEPALFADVIADLDRVHELSPSLAVAWNARFGLYAARGNLDQAFGDLRQAITDSPGAADPLQRLLVDQLVRTGRTAEAVEQAIRIADSEPEEMFWQIRSGELAVNSGRFRDAVRVLERFYGSDVLDGRPDVRRTTARLLLDSKLRLPQTPLRGEVLRLLEAAVDEDEADSVASLMLEARARETMGESQEALALAQRAFRAASTAQQINAYWNQLVLLLENPQTRQAFVERMIGQGESHPLIRLKLLQQRAVMSGMTPEIASAIASILDEAQAMDDRLTTVEAARALTSIYYTLGEYESLIAAARTGLEADPDDVKLNNDLAFTLVKHMDDAGGALPHAERAFAFAQDQPSVLDTVGLVWIENGRVQEAINALQRAQQLASSPDLLLPINVHLAQGHLLSGDEFAAEDAARAARRAFANASPAAREQYGPELDELERRIAG